VDTIVIAPAAQFKTGSPDAYGSSSDQHSRA